MDVLAAVPAQHSHATQPRRQLPASANTRSNGASGNERNLGDDGPPGTGKNGAGPKARTRRQETTDLLERGSIRAASARRPRKPWMKSRPSERRWSRIASDSTDLATVKKPQTRAICVAATIACANTSLVACARQLRIERTQARPAGAAGRSGPSAIEVVDHRPQPIAPAAAARRVSPAAALGGASAWISNASVEAGCPRDAAPHRRTSGLSSAEARSPTG